VRSRPPRPHRPPPRTRGRCAPCSSRSGPSGSWTAGRRCACSPRSPAGATVGPPTRSRSPCTGSPSTWRSRRPSRATRFPAWPASWRWSRGPGIGARWPPTGRTVRVAWCWSSARTASWIPRLRRWRSTARSCAGLTRHGDAVWVTGEDVDGPFAVELGPDGEALGRLPLPVAAEVVRPLPDGFLLATTDPPAAWRVDRRGSLRAGLGRRWGRGGGAWGGHVGRGGRQRARGRVVPDVPTAEGDRVPYLVHVTAGGSRRRWFPRHEPGQALWDGDDGYLISGLAGVSRRHAGGRPDGSFETRYGVGELGSGATGAVGLLSGSWAYSDRDWIATRLTSR
jgi:hypothetical protein